MARATQSSGASAGGSRAGVWVWFTGMLAFCLLLPVLASARHVAAFEAMDLELPQLTAFALRLGACLRCAAPLAVWVALTAVLGVPGLFTRNAHVQRLYLCGGIAATAVLLALVWSVQQATAGLQHALGD